MLKLIGSLLFGAGQVGIGAYLVVHGLQKNRWRRLGVVIAMLAGAWFITSGLAELLVSGMETAQRLGHGPTAAVFAQWRARADTLLFVVTLVLLAVGLGYVAVHSVAVHLVAVHRVGRIAGKRVSKDGRGEA
ncbi:MAG TPA: hypothetical protein VF120_16170 [Ktedonobacterales bacterium]